MCVLQISLNTRDVFIDVTATDLSKAKTVLNILCTMFSEYASEPYTTEPVEVIDALGNSTCEHTYLLLLPALLIFL